MAISPFPAYGSTNWYPWALDVDSVARAASVIEVERFSGTDTQKIKAAVAEAEASGGPFATVMLGSGKEYGITDRINVTEPIGFGGPGAHQTRLYHEGSYTGALVRMTDGRRNGDYEGSAGDHPDPVYAAAGRAGPRFFGFSMVDNDRHTLGRHGLHVLACDDVRVSNVWAGYLTGTAMKFGADSTDTDSHSSGTGSGRIRESTFHDVSVYRCGSGSPQIDSSHPDVPAFILQSRGGSGDGTNQNYFHQIRFVFNEGRMLLQGLTASGGAMRRNYFRDVQIHALYDSGWTNSGTTPTGHQNPFDIVTIQGDVGSTTFDGVSCNGNKSGHAMFRIREHPDYPTEWPNRVKLVNINALNMAGDFLRVSKCKEFYVDGDIANPAGLMIRADADPRVDNWLAWTYLSATPGNKISSALASNGTAYSNGVKITPSGA